jgi:glutamate-1-semialdehyde 2,1-aminomutase
MVTLFFARGPIQSWGDAKACDTAAFGRWHRGMIERGVYWPPAQFEAAFLSGAHTDADVDATVVACEGAL